MEQKRISIATLIAVLLVGLVAAYGAFRPGPVISGFSPQGVSNLNSLHLAVPTAQATGTPGLYVNNDSVARSIEVLNPSGTAVYAVDSDGAQTVGGNVDMGNNIIANIGAAGTDFGATGGLTLAAGLTVSDGDVVVADDLRITAQTSITVTNGAAFTPTGTYQPITAAGEVTPTITAGTAGQLLILVNESSETINLADSGDGNGADLTAAIALEQNEIIILISDGTDWLELSRAEN